MGRFWEAAKGYVAMTLAVILGTLVAAVLYLMRLLEGQRSAQKDREAAIERLRLKIEEAKKARESTLKQQTDAIQKKADARKLDKSVQTANQFIIDQLNRKKP